MAVEVINRIDSPELALGIVEVTGGEVREASDSLKATGAQLFSAMGRADYAIPDEQRIAVRRMLKAGGFSATGRNRPAQELLVRDMQERGEFHHINNVVDVNNVISLKHLLPISIFDIAKLDGPLIVRIAEEGEGYVFNQSGQYMDLKRCIVCCMGSDPGRPIGSPVKDSMETKIFEGATDYLGIIYISAQLYGDAQCSAITAEFADLLAAETGGTVIRADVVGG